MALLPFFSSPLRKGFLLFVVAKRNGMLTFATHAHIFKHMHAFVPPSSSPYVLTPGRVFKKRAMFWHHFSAKITKMFCKVVVWTGFTFASLQSTLVAVNARSLFKPRLLTLPLRTRKPFLGVYVKKLFSYIVQGSFFSSPANCTSEGSGRQFYSTDCAVATYLRHGHTRLILDDGRQYPPSHKSHMRLDFDIATVPSSFF